jgi:hypothetical protein
LATQLLSTIITASYYTVQVDETLASSLQMSTCMSKSDFNRLAASLMNASMLMQVEEISLAASCHL